MNTEKSQEQKLRRIIKSAGYELHKSRVRNINLDDLGGYQIVDPEYNCVVHGRRFELSLEDVAELVAEELSA